MLPCPERHQHHWGVTDLAISISAVQSSVQELGERILIFLENLQPWLPYALYHMTCIDTQSAGQQLYSYLGLGRNEKLPPHSFLM
jgi:hypothetical protein